MISKGSDPNAEKILRTMREMAIFK